MFVYMIINQKAGCLCLKWPGYLLQHFTSCELMWQQVWKVQLWPKCDKRDGASVCIGAVARQLALLFVRCGELQMFPVDRRTCSERWLMNWLTLNPQCNGKLLFCSTCAGRFFRGRITFIRLLISDVLLLYHPQKHMDFGALTKLTKLAIPAFCVKSMIVVRDLGLIWVKCNLFTGF